MFRPGTKRRSGRYLLHGARFGVDFWGRGRWKGSQLARLDCEKQGGLMLNAGVDNFSLGFYEQLFFGYFLENFSLSIFYRVSFPFFYYRISFFSKIE